MTVGEIYLENTRNTTGIVNRLLETFMKFGFNPQYCYEDDNYHKGKIIDWKTNDTLAIVHPPSDDLSKDYVNDKIARRVEIVVDERLEDLIAHFCTLTKKSNGPEVYVGVITPRKRNESAL